MNVRYREDQIDFFSNINSTSADEKRPRVLAAQLVLSSENLVILTICSILVIIFAFSLGMERGKFVALNTGSVLTSSAEVEREAVLPVKKEVPSSEITRSPVSADIAQAGLFDFFPKFAEAENKTEVAAVAKKQDVAAAVKSAKAVAQAISSDVAKVAVGGFTVQVASYKSNKFAQREADALKKKGYSDVYVMNKGKYVILCVGKFNSKAGADKLTKKLKNNYQDSVVRRL